MRASSWRTSRLISYCCWIYVSLLCFIFISIEVHPFQWRSVLCYRAGPDRQPLLSLQQETQPIYEGTSTSVTPGSSGHSCKICSHGNFKSRNELFRHIRSEHSSAKSNENLSIVQPLVRSQIAFLLSYYYDATTTISSENLSKKAGDRIKNACLSALNRTASVMDFGGMTQASVARQRHTSLTQEKNCAAAGDVIVINFKSLNGDDHLNSTFVDFMNEFLEEQQQNQRLRILSAVKIPPTISGSGLHAEKSCTQLAHHYLLPLWWLEDQSSSTDINNEFTIWWNNLNSGGEEAIKAQQCPPQTVLRLKAFLKGIRSRQVTQEEGSNSYNKKRFGLLAKFERRPFHNFGDPSLKGGLSPNHDQVWRTLDQVKIVDFISTNNNGLVAVVEFRGDGFLKEQIRRLIGTVVAVMNGWLPVCFFDFATRSDLAMIETPIAPDHRTYMAYARFHYYELITNHGIFSYKRAQPSPHFLSVPSRGSENLSDPANPEHRYELDMQRKNWTRDVQAALLKLSDTCAEQEWIRNLRDTISPRIRNSIEHISNRIPENLLTTVTIKNSLSDVPAVYIDTLTLLRTICASGQWPATSSARSRILVASSIKSVAEQNSNIGGSFTIINSELLSNSNGNSLPIPHSNSLFPDLVEAVFELERRLTSTDGYSRHPSTHCAINCNAQFTPHVDSGRGKGQSLSLIVSLGEFSGGRLFIEGDAHDIRYKPLEFDGWKLRHWTEAFKGERFSLVWFTPELS